MDDSKLTSIKGNKNINMKSEAILIIGSNGQIGTELAESLRGIYGTNNVVCSDLKLPPIETGPF